MLRHFPRFFAVKLIIVRMGIGGGVERKLGGWVGVRKSGHFFWKVGGNEPTTLRLLHFMI